MYELMDLNYQETCQENETESRYVSFHRKMFNINETRNKFLNSSVLSDMEILEW